MTPTQALIMLAGEGPEAPKHMAEPVKRLLVDKEKLMGTKELKIFDKIVHSSNLLIMKRGEVCPSPPK